MVLEFSLVWAGAASAVVLGWVYFRRCRITRPPLGVFNLLDVSVLLGAIALLRFLYLYLPVGLVAAVFGVGFLALLHSTVEPVLSGHWAAWLVALSAVAADVGAALLWGATSAPFLAVNNVVLIAAVAGVTNLWAQSGMKARDVALLAGILAVYDFVATAQLPLTAELVRRLAGITFAPLVAWPLGDGLWLGIGAGDLLFATLSPLVMRKAFGRRSGAVALALALGTLGGLLALPALGLVRSTYPAMVVLGPLIVAQYAYWLRRRGAERTTREYLEAEPLPPGTRSLPRALWSEGFRR